MLQQKVELAIEIEVLLPGVPVFHVKHYAGVADLYVARDTSHRWHSLTPVRNLTGWHQLESWHGDFPPIATLIEGAYPDLCGAPA